MNLFQVVAKQVGLSDSSKKYFALFLRTEHDFGKIRLHVGIIIVYTCTLFT